MLVGVKKIIGSKKIKSHDNSFFKITKASGNNLKNIRFKPYL